MLPSGLSQNVEMRGGQSTPSPLVCREKPRPPEPQVPLGQLLCTRIPPPLLPDEPLTTPVYVRAEGSLAPESAAALDAIFARLAVLAQRKRDGPSGLSARDTELATVESIFVAPTPEAEQQQRRSCNPSLPP